MNSHVTMGRVLSEVRTFFYSSVYGVDRYFAIVSGRKIFYRLSLRVSLCWKKVEELKKTHENREKSDFRKHIMGYDGMRGVEEGKNSMQTNILFSVKGSLILWKKNFDEKKTDQSYRLEWICEIWNTKVQRGEKQRKGEMEYWEGAVAHALKRRWVNEWSCQIWNEP